MRTLLLFVSLFLFSCSDPPADRDTPTPSAPTAAPAAPSAQAAPATQAAKPGLPVGQLKALAEKLRPLHETKRPPQPGDWLTKYPEPGQSFAAYLTYRPTPLTVKYPALYLRPVGDFNPKQQQLIADTAEFLGLFYHVPVKTLAPLALDVIPPKARRLNPHSGHPQIRTDAVINLMLKDRPKDALALLALTTSDLYPEDSWNFVFGQASLTDRVGVWSLYRYGDPEKDYATTLRRMLTVATHETGHMLGILHCTAYQCGMNGSNSLPEADRTPLYFCCECDPKVWFACQADPAQRYQALADFCLRRQLAPEAAAFKRFAEALREVGH